jgi:hypothetical protein
MRLLPNALACINCDLPIAAPPTAQPAAAQTPATPPGDATPGTPGDPPPYAVPPQQPYSPYQPAPGQWPPYGGPQPAYGGGYYGPPTGPTPWSTNGLSIASLILGMLWLGGVGSLLAIVFGHVSRGQIRKRPQRGAGLGLAGLIIGYLGLVGAIIFWSSIPRIIHSDAISGLFVRSDIDDAVSAEHDAYRDTGSYTNDGDVLSRYGYQSWPYNTETASYDATGFCIVAGRTSGHTWYLYDSTRDGLSDTRYSTAQLAEESCALAQPARFAIISR